MIINKSRLTREEAAKDCIGCSMTKLNQLERSGQLEGTYYMVGRRRFYITEKLQSWLFAGGEKSTSEIVGGIAE